MSGTDQLPLTDPERTDVRRFCGYPAFGSGQTGFESWRFFDQYGSLEYRMSNLSTSELTVVRNFLAQLNGLEPAVVGAGQNLDTDRASLWYRNKNELVDRANLLADWSRRLCMFLGVPPGPGLRDNAAIRI